MAVAIAENRTDVFRAEQIHPLEHRVLIRRAKRAEQSKGGIYIPETTQDLSQTGVIVCVADDVTILKSGDVVIFSQYAASPVIAVLDEQAELVMVRDKDVLAIVDQA